MSGVWREPGEETTDYPGLYLDDGRVTGSITAGQSRLPLWAFMPVALRHGKGEWKGYDPEQYGWTLEKASDFLYELLEQRGEFGRLLCILADVERRDRGRDTYKSWWHRKRQRDRVAAQLRRCLAVLEEMT